MLKTRHLPVFLRKTPSRATQPYVIFASAFGGSPKILPSYMPISLRREVFEALATRSLTTEYARLRATPVVCSGPPIFSRRMAQRAKRLTIEEFRPRPQNHLAASFTPWVRFFKSPTIALLRMKIFRPRTASIRAATVNGAVCCCQELISGNGSWLRFYKSRQWVRFFKLSKTPKLGFVAQNGLIGNLVPQKTPFLRLLAQNLHAYKAQRFPFGVE